MTAIGDFGKNVDEARNRLNTFSDDFVGDYVTEIDAKLAEIGGQIQTEVEKITGELKDLGLNSSQIPDEFYSAIEMYTDVISPVNTNTVQF